jgi:hypothetical protein
MKSLRFYVGLLARRNIEENCLKPQDIEVVPGAGGIAA